MDGRTIAWLRGTSSASWRRARFRTRSEALRAQDEVFGPVAPDTTALRALGEIGDRDLHRIDTARHRASAPVVPAARRRTRVKLRRRLTRTASWLTESGIFAASFDPAGIRYADGTPSGRTLTIALRKAGLIVDSRARRLVRRGGQAGIALPFTYLGSDDTAGPNYTGQPAVHSYYDMRPSPTRRQAH